MRTTVRQNHRAGLPVGGKPLGGSSGGTPEPRRDGCLPANVHRRKTLDTCQMITPSDISVDGSPHSAPDLLKKRKNLACPGWRLLETKSTGRGNSALYQRPLMSGLDVRFGLAGMRSLTECGWKGTAIRRSALLASLSLRHACGHGMGTCRLATARSLSLSHSIRMTGNKASRADAMLHDQQCRRFDHRALRPEAPARYSPECALWV